MKHLVYAFSLALVLAGVSGCGDNKPPQPGEKGSPPKPAETSEGHHDEGFGDNNHNGHEGHDHAKGGHEGEGEPNSLGSATIGAFTVKAVQMGHVEAGGEAVFELTVEKGGEPKSARFWIGTEDAKGSVKVRAKGSGPWHEHAVAPKPLPEGSKLWLELEAADGTKATGSFALAADDDDHEGHEGHDHDGHDH